MSEKRQRLLMALIVVLVLLTGLNLWVEPSDAVDAEAAPAAPLSHLSAHAIDGIALRGGPGQLVMERRDDGWWLEAPVAQVADPRRVQQLLEGVTGLRVGEPLGIDDLAGLGLAPPRRSIVLRSGGVTVAELEVGRPAPVGGGTYVRLGQDVHLSSRAMGAHVDGDVAHFRTREVVRFPRTAITSVRASGPSPGVELRREDGAWLADGGPVDGAKVDAMLRDMLDLRVRSVGAAAGVPEDDHSFELSGASGTWSLQIWRQGTQWYAISPFHQGPVEVSPGMAGHLPLSKLLQAEAP